MPKFTLHTEIAADITTCFDLARSIDFHKESLRHTEEIPISGKTTGRIALGEWVSWEAKHFGIVQYFTTKITEFEAPHYFKVEMAYGAFKSYTHKHSFVKEGVSTVMIDEVSFKSPYGALGRLVNIVFLKRYMVRLIKRRNTHLKLRAEAIYLKCLLKSSRLPMAKALV